VNDILISRITHEFFINYSKRRKKKKEKKKKKESQPKGRRPVCQGFCRFILFHNLWTREKIKRQNPKGLTFTNYWEPAYLCFTFLFFIVSQSFMGEKKQGIANLVRYLSRVTNERNGVNIVLMAY